MKKNNLWVVGLLVFGLSFLHGAFQVEGYHESNSGQFNHAIKELHKLNFLGSEKVLDIGCGDGRISLYIAQEHVPSGQLVGIDKDAEMITFACAHSVLPHISYVRADILEYVAPHGYDIVVSFWTLHWIAAYDKALENIARSLKPGGQALLCHVIEADPMLPMVKELLSTEKWQAYNKDDIFLLTVPSLSQVANAIEKTGLIIESLEIKKNGEWISIENLKKNLLSLPLFDFIPFNVRSEFCDEVLQNFIKEYPLNEKGEIFDWLPVVVMVLRK